MISSRVCLRRQQQQARGRLVLDVHYRLPSIFLDAVNGRQAADGMPNGGLLDVTIPPGVQRARSPPCGGKGARLPVRGVR